MQKILRMSHHYIKFSDVHFAYPGGCEALRGVNFHITHGERVALLGRNGAGKSTVILLTNGLLFADKGEVNIGDVPVCKKTLPIVRQSVGLVFQNADDQLFMPTVGEDVAFGPRNMKLPEKEIERRVSMALEKVGCSDLRGRESSRLSGGQKRMVSIATILSMEPSILVLDEPSANLDFIARRSLINVLKEFDHTILLATHDLAMAMELCQRTIVIDSGRVFADGPTENVLRDENVREVLGITSADL